MSLDRDKDPCEVYFSKYQKIKSGQMMPFRIEVYYAGALYAIFDVTSYNLK